jgi:hypothetical protein
MSAREAVRRLTPLGIRTELSGNGFVVAQRPLPGAPAVAGDVARLTLQRTPPRDEAGRTSP